MSVCPDHRLDRVNHLRMSLAFPVSPVLRYTFRKIKGRVSKLRCTVLYQTILFLWGKEDHTFFNAKYSAPRICFWTGDVVFYSNSITATNFKQAWSRPRTLFLNLRFLQHTQRYGLLCKPFGISAHLFQFQHTAGPCEAPPFLRFPLPYSYPRRAHRTRCSCK